MDMARNLVGQKYLDQGTVLAVCYLYVCLMSQTALFIDGQIVDSKCFQNPPCRAGTVFVSVTILLVILLLLISLDAVTNHYTNTYNTPPITVIRRS